MTSEYSAEQLPQIEVAQIDRKRKMPVCPLTVPAVGTLRPIIKQ